MGITAAVNIRPAVGIVVFVVVLFAVVMLHEFGHYVMARRSGMKVSEFFFGFGPALWRVRYAYRYVYDLDTKKEVARRRRRIERARSTQDDQAPTDTAESEWAAVEPTEDERKKLQGPHDRVVEIDGKRFGEYENETDFGIKAIPLGGYVKIAGMNPYEATAPSDEGHTYADKPAPRRALAILAGPVSNLLVAYLLLIGLALGGQLPGQERPVPRIADMALPIGCDTPEGESTVDGTSCAAPTPAAQAGLQPGDRFVAIDGRPVGEWAEVRSALVANKGKSIVVQVEREGAQIDLPVHVATRPPVGGETDEQPFIGIIVATERVGDPPLMAPVTAGKTMGILAATAGYAIYKFFSPENLKRYLGLLGGSRDEQANNARFVSPVGVARLSAQAADAGWVNLVWIIVIFNLFLGLFNLIPLPPLDGGHLAVVGYEALAGKVTGRRVEVDPKKLMPITLIVIGVFVAIGITSLYLDIASPIQNIFR